MTRREWLAAAAAWASVPALVSGQHGGRRMVHPPQTPEELAGPADVTLRIGQCRHEIAPRREVRTLAYNGQVPGPLVRVRRGRPMTVDVFNDTASEDIVHWHGLHIPADVDGVYEQGTPGVPPRGRRRYLFTPEPAGTRWYHSHDTAANDLGKGTYTGQFGVMVVEDGDPGSYDADVPLVLHEWEPSFRREGTRDVEFKSYSINGRMLGAGEPLRVKEGSRVLFRIVNASATLTHQLALAGHRFHVLALDGNPVPTPLAVPIVEVAPGERVDATVEMDHPGVWVLGAPRAADRDKGLGLVVEYAGASGPPRWQEPLPRPWDYTIFGVRETPSAAIDGRLTLAFRAVDGHHWTINGKQYPKTDDIVVQAGKRYRWTLDNQSADPHPVHLHRHTFELARVDGRPTSGLMKDVVVVPPWKQVDIDVTADQPGLALFHCHQQFHMDNGFMAMMRYEG
ncbi:MAG: multicopper oxidase family protein [Vicinamibacterales bacterium]